MQVYIYFPDGDTQSHDRGLVWIAKITQWIGTQPPELDFFNKRTSFDPLTKKFMVDADNWEVLRWGVKGSNTKYFGLVTKFGSVQPMTQDEARNYIQKNVRLDKSQTQTSPQPEPLPVVPQTQTQVTPILPDAEKAPTTASGLPRIDTLKDFTTAELISELRTRGIWFEE